MQVMSIFDNYIFKLLYISYFGELTVILNVFLILKCVF